ncbi:MULTISPECIES: S-type pyocin domain-containing protein [Pseudomonas fluorescens group]|uniref:S-type Pyocin n=1 Tax=Pseudomonas fluorescens TaxID=294 RepID=A0A0D0RJQ2_PSEFL|nr:MULTISPECIES: S-type pyocin domain-containing protein [Pseudomonas fluorescens group]AZE60958.1 Uropathogenic specific protein [Pseudomonas synxantha]KIR19712.1 S-type Pyocin [Pseudomonas fluorescens]
MRRYNITTGSTTTAGGKVISGCERTSFNGEMISREGDRVACPACGTEGFIALTGPHLHEEWDGKQAALEGDLCICKCDPPPELIANQSFKSQQFGPQPQRFTAAGMGPTASVSPPPSFSAPVAPNRAVDACVFAKSCVSVPAGSTDAGTGPENAGNFGTTAVMVSTGTTGAVGRVAGTLGSDLGAWAVRGLAGASSALNVVLLAFWPRDIGDSTLYSPAQLAGMRSASTRVRFQFRQDESGELRVYGIHTKPESGADRVPVAQARWNTDNSAMVAVLDGISITWTPNRGPVVSAPSPYPGTPERLDNLFVHPVAVGQDSAISHYPGREAENVTWQDTIISFPADSGLSPLYLVFAKPAVRPLEVDVYGAFSGRPRNGLHVDHMPSQAALRRYLDARIKLDDDEIEALMKRAASIAIPAEVHQKYSETYGWRNTRAKQYLDAGDLRGALESNFNAIKPYMLEQGFTESQLQDACAKMHKINESQGWY